MLQQTETFFFSNNKDMQTGNGVTTEETGCSDLPKRRHGQANCMKTLYIHHVDNDFLTTNQ